MQKYHKGDLTRKNVWLNDAFTCAQDSESYLLSVAPDGVTKRRTYIVKKIVSLSIAAAVMAIPGAAYAQDSQAEVTIGATAGVHTLGVSDELDDAGFPDANDTSAIFGGFVTVDFPVGSNVFAGVEGNLNIGTAAIDAEYGAAARLGYRASNGTKVYLRGGYQWVDLDVGNILNIDEDFDGLDTTVDDYMVGGGIEFPIGNAAIRFDVDTISFDTLRGTAGVGFRF